MGFRAVMSGPLVRSSYYADELNLSGFNTLIFLCIMDLNYLERKEIKDICVHSFCDF